MILRRALRVGLVAAGLFPWAVTLLRAALPLGVVGVALDALFVTVCHRLPERTLSLAGVAMPVCSRCAGIFAGVAVGALAAWPRAPARRWRAAITAAGAALFVDVVTQDLGLHPPWHPVRLATGLAFGYAIGAASVDLSG